MKKLIGVLSVLFSLSAYSQIDHIQVLVGLTEPEVRVYMDSLLNLKTNPYYKIKQDVNNTGDLILKSEFALSDESFYNCHSIQCLFTRSGGVEYCTRQLIIGQSQFATSNLNFIKDNFKKMASGKWQMQLNENYKAFATFEVTENNEYKSYLIVYDLIY